MLNNLSHLSPTSLNTFDLATKSYQKLLINKPSTLFMTIFQNQSDFSYSYDVKTFLNILLSKEEGDDQELIQSSTTSDPGYEGYSNMNASSFITFFT